MEKLRQNDLSHDSLDRHDEADSFQTLEPRWYLGRRQ